VLAADERVTEIVTGVALVSGGELDQRTNRDQHQ
jgi:hypothetical protein